FDGDDAGHRHDAALGGRVGEVAADIGESAHRRIVDDGAATIAQQRGNGVLAAKEAALEVDVDHPLKQFFGDLVRRGDRLLDTGIVEDGVELAVLALGQRHQGGNIGFNGYV